jgi:hypothetical protein
MEAKSYMWSPRQFGERERERVTYNHAHLKLLVQSLWIM